jgi:hypothetical protein
MPSIFTLEGADLSTLPAARPTLWTTTEAQDLNRRLQQLPLMRQFDGQPQPLRKQQEFWPLGAKTQFWDFDKPHGPVFGPQRPTAEQLYNAYPEHMRWPVTIGPQRVTPATMQAWQRGFAGVGDLGEQRSPLATAAIAFGISLALSVAAGSAAVWALKRMNGRR